jgi:type IV pilus assembly protein PilN
MIRINLLGQKPPKKPARAVPTGVAITVFLFLGSIIVAGGVLWVVLNDKDKQILQTQQQVDTLQREIAGLQAIKNQVDSLNAQKQVLDRQLQVLDALRQNRTGGQELMDSLAGTVIRTEAVWLTSMEKKGSALNLEGTAGSVTAVANFITELKRSGYFTKVEISESQQDARNTAVTTFLFKLTVLFAPPQSKPPAAAGATS